jgi:F-type H+-transporting ATPase subunit c
MNVMKSIILAIALVLLVQGGSAFAQGGAAGTGSAPATTTVTSLLDLRTFAAGLVIMGAAYGIGILARAAVESQARQPEMAGQIQTTMIIAAALIEGVTLFGLVIILIAVLQGR